MHCDIIKDDFWDERPGLLYMQNGLLSGLQDLWGVVSKLKTTLKLQVSLVFLSRCIVCLLKLKIYLSLEVLQRVRLTFFHKGVEDDGEHSFLDGIIQLQHPGHSRGLSPHSNLYWCVYSMQTRICIVPQRHSTLSLPTTFSNTHLKFKHAAKRKRSLEHRAVENVPIPKVRFFLLQSNTTDW